MADSMSQAASDLYAMPPAEFTSARDKLAKQASAAGERDAAAQIKKLARPTVSAWLVNQLVRNSQQQLSRLFEVGQSMHAAQQELAGDKLRELSAQRRQVIAELMPEATRLAADSGVTVSASAMDEVRATLEAALADAGARDAVRSGQLTRALSYAGLGEVDLAAALAVVPGTRAASHRPSGRAEGDRRGRPARKPGEPSVASAAGKASASGQAEAGQRSAAERAGLAVAEAEAAVAEATQELAAAEGNASSLAEQRQFLSRRMAHLHNELSRAEAEDRAMATAVRDAKRSQDAAARALARAERQLAQARQRADSPDGPATGR